LRFIAQVLKERELGNVLEFPAVAEAIPVAKVLKSGGMGK
jgi:hypothetical protein